MKNVITFFFGVLILVSCQSPTSTSATVQATTFPNGVNPEQEQEMTLRILNKMVQIRGGEEYLFVKTVKLIETQTTEINNVYQLKVVAASYILAVKKDFYKRASDISDMANLTRPPFYSKLDQAQLYRQADVTIAYKKGQEIQLDWKLVFQKNSEGLYERVFPNPENESELLTPEAYEKLLESHLPANK